MSKFDRFIYRTRFIFRGEQSRGIRGGAGPSISGDGHLYARAVDTAAFFADLGSGGEVNVQRQEEKEQQRCNGENTCKLIRFGSQRRQHEKNLA